MKYEWTWAPRPERVEPDRHRAQPWRVHTLCPDFELVDVWTVPVIVDAADKDAFARFFDLVWDIGIDSGNWSTRALVRLRKVLGETFGWDKDPSRVMKPGEIRVSDRLTDEDRRRNREPVKASSCAMREQGGCADTTRLAYRFENEALVEIANDVGKAMFHFAFVPLPDGKKTCELAVYFKSTGIKSRLYMALINPFRRHVVYPAWTKNLANRYRELNGLAPAAARSA